MKRAPCRLEGSILRADLEKALSSLVASELALFNELSLLVEKEEECVRAEDMEALLSILQEKQDVISRQESIQEGWGSIASSLGISEGRDGPSFWDFLSAHLGEEGANDLKASLSVIRDVAGKVLEQEVRVQALLEQHVESLRKQMAQVSRGKKALHGYSKAGGV